MRFGAMQVDGSTKFVFAIDPTTIEDVFDFVNVTGSIQDLSKINTIAVDKKVAEKNGWAIGTTVDVTFASETTPMEIVALIDGSKAFANWGMGIPTYELHFADQFDSFVFVKLKPGADTAAFEQGVNNILKDYPTAELQTPEQFTNSVAGQINQLVSVIYALLFLAIIIALLGIANTLALSIYERRHEIGLLARGRHDETPSAFFGALGVGDHRALRHRARARHRRRVRSGDRAIAADARVHGLRDPVRPAGRGRDPRRPRGRRRRDPARAQGGQARHPVVHRDRVADGRLLGHAPGEEAGHQGRGRGGGARSARRVRRPRRRRAGHRCEPRAAARRT